jgi:hypothetical protein
VDQKEKSITSDDIPLILRRLETQVELRFEANREKTEVLKITRMQKK